MKKKLRMINPLNFFLVAILLFRMVTFSQTSQEMLESLKSQMNITKFCDTLPESFHDSLKVVNYLNQNGQDVSQIGYYPDGRICYYNVGFQAPARAHLA